MTRRILIVDDEQFFLRNLTRTLSRETTYEVAGVDSVREAREALEYFRPDLVVCDLELSDGTGIDVLDLLRRHGLSIPFVVLSRHVDGYIDALPDDPRVVARRKPVRASELLELIDGQLAATERTGPVAFSLSDYLQMAHFSRRSIRIVMRYEGGAVGAVDVWTGDPWKARCGNLEGNQALGRMLSLRPVALSTTSLTEPPATRQIDMPTPLLLLALAKESDECARHGKREPSGPTVTTELSLEDTLAAFLGAIEGWQLSEAASFLHAARRLAPSDARLQAWWCDLVLEWPHAENRLPDHGPQAGGAA